MTRSKGFAFATGHILAGKYEVLEFLGGGFEGEVYKIRERGTRIERAAKVFYPKRNPNNRTAARYAKKLHKLRTCPILIHYHTYETIEHQDRQVTLFISEYVEGELLRSYAKRFRDRRMPLFQAVHLLHALAVGVESIHRMGEYHGDLHSENVIVERLGLTFDLKLLDLFHWGPANRDNRHHDICSMIRIFYDVLGGQKYYSRQPDSVREICCGLKQSLIRKRFKSASDLRLHIENRNWGKT
ncbi:MAG: serine/threonine protein kinase [marine bacterium B5-7]|nr:MAG: serine/threonine protein kinase [marine bacterium B5-7]